MDEINNKPVPVSEPPSPIDEIDYGINNGNWEQVCNGFLRLTGKKRKPPKDKKDFHLKQLHKLKKVIDLYLQDKPVLIEERAEGSKQENTLVEDFDDGPLPPKRELRFVQKSRPQTQAPREITDEERIEALRKGQDPNNFQIQNKGTNSGKKLQWEPPSGHQRFEDNLTEERGLLKADRQLAATLTELTERRESIVFIDAVCSECSKKYNVHPALVPRRLGLDKDDAITRWICDNCISRKVPK